MSVRVTRPIIANNAGGAGYFAGTSQPVDINVIAQDFLEQLKQQTSILVRLKIRIHLIQILI
ncbi:hypothetical protein H6769_01855 [Candidatus Peribacteria bacterium]|nr:hypothetical protein [Candidatus Peribacteria bacterium]